MQRKGVGPYGVQPAKVLLKEAGISRPLLANQIGRTQPNLTLTLNGWIMPPLAVAASIARAIGKPIEDCFTPTLLGAGE